MRLAGNLGAHIAGRLFSLALALLHETPLLNYLQFFHKPESYILILLTRLSRYNDTLVLLIALDGLLFDEVPHGLACLVLWLGLSSIYWINFELTLKLLKCCSHLC